jgi:hypothetical protein
VGAVLGRAVGAPVVGEVLGSAPGTTGSPSTPGTTGTPLTVTGSATPGMVIVALRSLSLPTQCRPYPAATVYVIR